MALIYEETSGGRGGAISTASMDATACWLTHFSNSLHLKFIAERSTDVHERAQANKELAIAERKMAFWKKHPNFETLKAANGAAALKKNWSAA